MPDEEVGRWACETCGKMIVAAGPVTRSFRGIGAFVGPCPWDCGASINRGFRGIRPGQVKAYRADEWDSRAPASSTWP